MPAPYRTLLLRLDPAQPGLADRLVALGIPLARRGAELLLPLGDRRAEEVLAECCRLGVTVVGSTVEPVSEGG
ncbi:MAG TPA: hypothetical protein VMJ30_09890 [Gemmatimonadales bacterium]|nr:hypothetical protein [Gemmatimonadales bacterium]